jgi:NADH dehydrogenase
MKDSNALERPSNAGVVGRKPRVVILGGGFAGLNAAKSLAGAPVEVVLVDKENYHLFQPLLYQVATAGLSSGDIATPIRSILRHEDNVSVRMAEATGIDRESRRVDLADGSIAYDYLMVATGTRPKYFGPDRWRKHSTPLKTVDDAIALRRQILYAFERAEQADDAETIEEWLTFVVVGGGATGVEMAGAIREIAAEVMVRDFRTIEPEEARVILIDAMPAVLNGYPEELSEHARQELEDRDVEVILDSPVEDIREDRVEVDGQTIQTRTVVWAAGVEPTPLVQSLGIETTDGGQVPVAADLRLKEDPRVFALGDIAYLEDDDGQPLPGIAPVAIQQGNHAARAIRDLVDGESTEAFDYRDRGMMSTIGRKSAVGVVGNWHLKGFLAWLAWLFIHLLFLIGFRNKLSVMINWAYSYIAFGRGSRLIVGDVHARNALPAETDTDSESEAA